MTMRFAAVAARLFAAPLFAALAMPACAAEQAIVADAASVQGLIAKARAEQQGRPMVSENILTLAPYRANLEYRAGKAPASVHETEAEVMIVLDGRGALITGGQLTNEKRANPTNLSGDGISGGTSTPLAKGDFTIVPEKVAHQLIPAGDTPLVLMTLHVPRANAPAGTPKLFASASDVEALRDKAKAALKPGQTFASQTLLALPPYRMGLEYRTPKGTPSVHSTEAEIMYVIEGAGTIRTDGTLVDATQSAPNNLQGSAIAGGVEHHLAKGDFIFVPQGTPHQAFTDGTFVLATLHVPRPVPGP